MSLLIAAALLSAWTRTTLEAPLTPTQIEIASSNTVFAVDGSLWRSVDAGRTWQTVDLSGVTAVASDPAVVYAAATGGAVWKSADAGATWSRLPPNDGSPLIAKLATDRSDLYAARHNGGASALLKSTNGGMNWSVFLTRRIVDFAIDPFNASTFYAVYREDPLGGLARSDDGGKSWSYPFNSSFVRVNNVVADPARPNVVYVTVVASFTNDLLVSRDAGKTWSPMPVAVDGREVNVAELLLDPANPANMYATTYPSGVVRSTDGGLSWTRINDGLPSAFVSALAIDPAGRYLLAAVDRSVYRLDMTSPRRRAVRR